MLKIMSWNIERLGLNKLLTNNWDKTGMREDHILETIELVDPDVLVLQEVQTTWTGFGDLITGLSGPLAVMHVQNWLQENFEEEEWSLVPPAILTPNGGYSEGIGVLFKANRLSFEGPMIWTGAEGIQDPAGGGVPALYPGLWENTLPEAASHTPPETEQRMLAGRYEFLDGEGNRLQFGGPNTRSIWQTRFYDPTAARYLDLYSLHFPPQPNRAKAALGDLARIPHFVAAPAAAEDRVIVGDYNLNANSESGEWFGQFTNEEEQVPGAPLVTVQYQLVFEEEPATLSTNVRRVLGGETNGVAPLYGYTARNTAGVPKALDNALVVRGGVAALANNQYVANRIFGPVLAIDMVNSIPEINAGIGNAAGQKKRFNTLVNFGHIGGRRGASDHLGIVFELP
jgi:endonuclease/exonuclease/phosphatase family metal-dependent hydrolase